MPEAPVHRQLLPLLRGEPRHEVVDLSGVGCQHAIAGEIQALGRGRRIKSTVVAEVVEIQLNKHDPAFIQCHCDRVLVACQSQEALRDT